MDQSLCGSHKLRGVQHITRKLLLFQPPGPIMQQISGIFLGPQLQRHTTFVKWHRTGPLTVALQQQTQLIIRERWRLGKMTRFIAGIRMPKWTSRIWPLEIYHFVSLFPCCPYHTKFSLGSSQAGNHLEILGLSISQTALSLIQLQPRLQLMAFTSICGKQFNSIETSFHKYGQSPWSPETNSILLAH